MLEQERLINSPEIILITGAANGMGLETTIALASDPKAIIYATDFDPVIFERYPKTEFPNVEKNNQD